ncbi:hypothetical protein, partial [Escherichia coli]|uniref:hypothetical protein n=1 Tax=Escherichia coli TaxID=562 RepID=UPI0023B2D0A2
FRLPGVTFFCISDTLVPTTYFVDTTLSNASDSDQTVQAVRLLRRCPVLKHQASVTLATAVFDLL